MDSGELTTAARTVIESEWATVDAATEQSVIELSDELQEAIIRSVNCKTKTYRYVLPTQILAKVADSSLDSRCLQASRGGAGAFDARTVAHKVIVPFDQENHRVLGGSAEPYVSNPLRVNEITPQFASAQRNKDGWADLCRVLEEVEQRDEPVFTLSVLRFILSAIYDRLQTVRIVYPAPTRISLDACLKIIESFLGSRSGGDRFEAIATALFVTLGRTFSIYAEVRRGKVTASDQSTGMVADIECLDANGDIVLGVEAKDRELTITQLKDKVPGLRESGVTEAIFIAGEGSAAGDADEIQEVIDREYVSGQNIYVTELIPLCRVLLTLVGEKGRRKFLTAVAEQLDEHSELVHRREWANLLQAV